MLNDFSEHTHTVTRYKADNGDEIRVDELRKGNSRYEYVKFVNDREGLSVFGDFGNWIFCRPFYPSAGQKVSPDYWLEKLRVSSCQEPSKYDPERTEEELHRLINGELAEWGYEGEDLERCTEWLKELLRYVDDELEYTYEAYRGENPTEMDCEYIPFVKTISVQLEIVFEAFNEICNRL